MCDVQPSRGRRRLTRQSMKRVFRDIESVWNNDWRDTLKSLLYRTKAPLQILFYWYFILFPGDISFPRYTSHGRNREAARGFQRNIKRSYRKSRTAHGDTSTTYEFLFNAAKAMDFFDTRFFRINKLFLSFVGLWPYQMFFMKALSLSFAIFGIGIMSLPQVQRSPDKSVD